MMKPADVKQLKSFSPSMLRLARVLLALAAALMTVALLVASYRVGSLYSPTSLLLAPAPHPSVLHPILEAAFYAMGGHFVPQG